MSHATQKVTPSAIRPCVGPCGRLTRPSDLRFAMAPETVPRWKDGKCARCYRRETGIKSRKPGERRGRTEPQVRLCAGGCGRHTRPSGVRAEEAPDTVARCRNDMCKSCVARIEGLSASTRQNRKQPTSEEVIDRYRHSLESWLNGWRKRNERATKRELYSGVGDLQERRRREVVLSRQGEEWGNRRAV